MEVMGKEGSPGSGTGRCEEEEGEEEGEGWVEAPACGRRRDGKVEVVAWREGGPPAKPRSGGGVKAGIVRTTSGRRGKEDDEGGHGPTGKEDTSTSCRLQLFFSITFRKSVTIFLLVNALTCVTRLRASHIPVWPRITSSSSRFSNPSLDAVFQINSPSNGRPLQPQKGLLSPLLSPPKIRPSASPAAPQ